MWNLHTHLLWWSRSSSSTPPAVPVSSRPGRVSGTGLSRGSHPGGNHSTWGHELSRQLERTGVLLFRQLPDFFRQIEDAVLHGLVEFHFSSGEEQALAGENHPGSHGPL